MHAYLTSLGDKSHDAYYDHKAGGGCTYQQRAGGAWHILADRSGARDKATPYGDSSFDRLGCERY